MTNKKPDIKKMRGESAKSYALRCVYMDLPPKKRSIKKTVETFYNVTKSDKNYKNLYSKTRNIAANWLWKQCAELNDAQKRLEQVKLKAEHTEEVNETILGIIEKEIVAISEMLDITNNDKTYDFKTKADIKQTLIRNLKNLNEMFRLASGLSTTNNDINLNAILDVEAKTEVEISKESVFDFIDKELGINDGD